MDKVLGAITRGRVFVVCLLALLLPLSAVAEHSAARIWNEELLFAIRRDQARPTVHARNLFHVSIAMWDAWAGYDARARGYLVDEKHAAADANAARAEALGFACYRILRHRFANSPGRVASYAEFDARMAALGYDSAFTSVDGDSPAAFGNRIAAAVLAFGAEDGSNEAQGFAATNGYAPVNEPLVVALSGTEMVDPNRWQALALEFFIDQSGIVIGAYPPHLTPHWAEVTPFSLTAADRFPHTH